MCADESSPLHFLTALDRLDRTDAMAQDMEFALRKEMSVQLGDPQAPNLRNYFALAFQNIPQWIQSDASEELLQTLDNGRPFGLYLRSFASECANELVGTQPLRAWRSIEIGNIGRISKQLPIFGLSNTLDVNPLRKYRSVWLPPDFRHQWREIVYELAKRSCLIIINASVPGSGLSEELKRIPPAFPQKTWLIAGKQKNVSLVGDVAQAANALAGLPDHVSIADVENGIVGDAWPDRPQWVVDIVGRACR